jgi:hypothetical protein
MPEFEIVEINAPLTKVSRVYFNISNRRYRQLADEQVVPPVVKGKIPLLAAFKALLAYKTKLSEGQGSLNLTDVRTRKENARAEREELIVKKMRGEQVPKDQVEKWLHGHVEEAKGAILGLPRRMGPVLAPLIDEKEIEFLLQEQIYKILEELAKPLHAKKQPRRKNSRRSTTLVATARADHGPGLG